MSFLIQALGINVINQNQTGRHTDTKTHTHPTIHIWKGDIFNTFFDTFSLNYICFAHSICEGQLKAIKLSSSQMRQEVDACILHVSLAIFVPRYTVAVNYRHRDYSMHIEKAFVRSSTIITLLHNGFTKCSQCLKYYHYSLKT